jgi:hypothetical protein
MFVKCPECGEKQGIGKLTKLEVFLLIVGSLGYLAYWLVVIKFGGAGM